MAENDDILLMGSDDDDLENMYLVFGVTDEEYAVNIAHVTEIVGMQRISEVPDVPDFIKGVTNLRGQVIPVMDVRLRFGLPWQDYTDRTTIIVLELDGAPTGLVVDSVNEVRDIAPEQIDPPPNWHHTGDTGGVIKGLGKTDNSVCIILDVRRLLDDREIQLDIVRRTTAPTEAAMA